MSTHWLKPPVFGQLKEDHNSGWKHRNTSFKLTCRRIHGFILEIALLRQGKVLVLYYRTKKVCEHSTSYTTSLHTRFAQRNVNNGEKGLHKGDEKRPSALPPTQLLSSGQKPLSKYRGKEMYRIATDDSSGSSQ